MYGPSTNQQTDECEGGDSDKACRKTVHNNNPEKEKSPKGLVETERSRGLKEEPRDDIKNYAEDTMNELLGWYGYGSEALNRVSDQMRRKRSQPDETSCSSADHVTVAVEDSGDDVGDDVDELEDCEDDESLCSRSMGHSQGTSSQEDGMPSLAPEVADITATEVKAEEPAFVVCSWCQKGQNLKNQFVLQTSEGKRKFCSQLCFDQCRREKYRKHKICEWCKEACASSNIVEFEDGDGLYLFCSDNCLNKYKMNIFCQETQEHIKTLQTEGTLKLTKATSPSDSQKQIIITPDLWTDENRKKFKPKPDKERHIGKTFMEIARNVEKTAHDSFVSQAAAIPTLENMMEPKPLVRQPRHTTPLRSKSDSEHSPRPSRSNQRPPRMTDREKIKQIRLRDNLPLYTPLRETCRSNTDTFSISSLTSRCLSNSSTKSTAQQSNMTPSLASGMYTPASSSQLLDTSLIGAASVYSKTPSMHGELDTRSGDGRTSVDSCSSQSVSPTTSSHSQSTPVPPLYPPPNPFTHTSLPSYLTNPSFPFPLPPHMSMYSGLYGPPPMLGSLATPMSSIMPPNTLMMPYPFVLPLPIPLPIPVPVPQTFIDELSKTASKPEESSINFQDVKTKRDIGSLNVEDEIETRRIKTEVSSTKEMEKRYYIDLDPSRVKSSVSVSSENEVMDLSKEASHSGPRSKSPTERNRPSSQQELPTQNGILVIEPEDNRLTPPKSPLHTVVTATSQCPLNTTVTATGQCPGNQKYSARRNLILDAPNARQEGSLSPSAEKRGYGGSSVRDMLYGKRKCIRARVKTK